MCIRDRLVAAIVPGLIVILSLFLVQALFALVGFGTVGIYVGFGMVVLAALRRGRPVAR